MCIGTPVICEIKALASHIAMSSHQIKTIDDVTSAAMERIMDPDSIPHAAIIADEDTIAAQPRAGSGVVLPGGVIAVDTIPTALIGSDLSSETARSMAYIPERSIEENGTSSDASQSPKQNRDRGHRRQRSASWSEADARQLLANMTPPPVTTSSGITRFIIFTCLMT